MVTQERLRELFSYNPNTGNFIRLVGRSGPNARAGDIAGCDNGQGYVRIYVDGKAYKAHRLAWMYTHGEWPNHIDHVNGIRSDNRIENLRSVVRSQNNMNKGLYKNSTSGLKGASFNERSGKWKSQIQVSGKKMGLGYFQTKEEAHQAYLEVSRKFHGEYARGK